MRSSLLPVAVLALLFPTISHAISWTETFDTGFGMFSTTSGNGASDYQYDPIDQNIAGSFIRGPVLNRRVALLGRTFTQSDFARFSVDVTPRSEDFSRPGIGFFDSGGNAGIFFEIDDNPLVISPIFIQGNNPAQNPEFPFTSPVAYQFDKTYRVELELDGPNNQFTMRVFSNENNILAMLGQQTFALPAGVPFTFDSLGMQNLVDDTQGIGATTITDLDNFSFFAPDIVTTVGVPEPTTALVLFFAVTCAGFQRRAKTCR